MSAAELDISGLRVSGAGSAAEQLDVAGVGESGDEPALEAARDKLRRFWEKELDEEDHVEEWLTPWSVYGPLLTPLLTPHSRVLVVGCGTSSTCVDLLHHAQRSVPGLQIVGCDIAENVIEVQKQRLQDHVFLNGVTLTYLVADCTKLPFANASFSLVLDKCTSDTLRFRTSKRHYVGDLLVRVFFAESYRILQKTGTLCIITPKRLVPGLHDKARYVDIAEPGQDTGVSAEGKLLPRSNLKPFRAVTASVDFPFAKVKKTLISSDANLPEAFHKHKGYFHTCYKTWSEELK